MPARVVVQLEPVRANAVPAQHTGPAVYAAVLDSVRKLDKGLAELLHDGPRYKPFALTPLLAGWGTPAAQPRGACRVEVSLLSDELVAPVLAALVGREQWQIGPTAFRAAAVAPEAVVPFESLLRGARRCTSWEFHLVTPVSFATARDEGVRRERPWPDAVRVLGNLARRWEAFAGGVVPGVAEAIADHAETTGGEVRIMDYLVKSAPNRSTSQVHRRGAVGRVRYRLAEPGSIAPDVVQAIDALASFAEYAGFGDRSAVGMGHVRLLG